MPRPVAQSTSSAVQTLQAASSTPCALGTPANGAVQSDALVAVEERTPPGQSTTDQGQQTTPDKLLTLVPRRGVPKPNWGNMQRPLREGTFSLIEVGLDRFGSGSSLHRPVRHHIPPLNHWRNEQVVYERKPGSPLPTISAVVLAKPCWHQEASLSPLVPLVDSPASSEKSTASRDASHSRDEVENRQSTSTQAPATAKARIPSSSATQHGKKIQARSKGSASVGKKISSRSSGFEQIARPQASHLMQESGPKTWDRPQKRVRTAARTRVGSGQASVKVASPKSRRICKRSPATDDAARRAQISSTEDVSTVPQLELLEQGFCRVPPAEGSQHACEIRVGLDNGYWMCCDINIPPRSFNTPERLVPGKTLQMYILGAERGVLVAELDGNILGLEASDHLLVRPGQEYCLRNNSDSQYARLKMVLVTVPCEGAANE